MLTKLKVKLCISHFSYAIFKYCKRDLLSKQREKAWRSDLGISSLDIITVVCNVFYASRPRELTPLRRFAKEIG